MLLGRQLAPDQDSTIGACPILGPDERTLIHAEAILYVVALFVLMSLFGLTYCSRGELCSFSVLDCRATSLRPAAATVGHQAALLTTTILAAVEALCRQISTSQGTTYHGHVLAMLRQAGIIASSITGMLRAIAYYRMSSPSPETPSSGVRRCFLLLASLVVVVAPVLIWIIQFCALSWNRLKLRGCVGSGEGPATSEAITLNAVTMSLTLPLTTVVNVGGYSGLLWKTWQRDRQRRNMGQRRILRRDILFEIFLLTALCFPMNVIDIWCAIKDENIAHRFISSVLFVVFAVSLATKISIYQPDSNQGSSNSNIIDIMRCETKHDDIQEKTTDSSDKRNNIIENQSLRLETFNRIEHSDNKHIVVVSSNCPSEDNESFVSVKATHKMTYRLDSGDMTPRPDCEHLDCLDIDRASVCSGRKTGARCPILQSPDGSPVNAIPIHRASTTSRLSVISCLGDNNIPGQQERHTSVFSIAKYCHSDLSCVQDEVPEKKHRPSFSGSLVSDTTIPMKRLWMNYAIGDVDLL